MKKELSVIITFSLLLTLGLAGVSKIRTNYSNSALNTTIQPSPSEQKIDREKMHITTTPSELPSPQQPLIPITKAQQVFTLIDEQKAEKQIIDLVVTGDVLLARHVNVLMEQKNDFSWPFHNVAELLKTADISFINLETPLTKDCRSRSDGMIFCGSTKAITGLQYAGIDVVNLANNHASNQGPEGVSETIEALQEVGIAVTGATNNNAVYTTVSGIKFAFLGFNEVNNQAGVTTAYPETIKQEVTQARMEADVVVVQFHWGNEYTYSPSAHQRELARLAVDSGADLIVGNHPHWFQPYEFYKDTMIMYSHGNLIFDQMWSRETRIGVIGHYQFSDKKLVGVTFIPTRIDEFGQPVILEGNEAEEVLNKLQSESRKLELE